jgi:hypothetical protein
MNSKSDKQKEFDELNITVYITRTGKYYHQERCGKLKYSKIAIKLTDAIDQGYKRCPYWHEKNNWVEAIMCFVVVIILISVAISFV